MRSWREFGEGDVSSRNHSRSVITFGNVCSQRKVRVVRIVEYHQPVEIIGVGQKLKCVLESVLRMLSSQ
jgi:hypothetical protein